jgi:hypothetical protein
MALAVSFHLVFEDANQRFDVCEYELQECIDVGEVDLVLEPLCVLADSAAGDETNGLLWLEVESAADGDNYELEAVLAL